MKKEELLKNAFSMPYHNPSYPRGPYRFTNREFMIITYESDLDAVKSLVPEPLEVIDATVNYEFIKMPDSTGFGCYTESGQVIPVKFKGEKVGYTHNMYLDDHSPIAGGRELWGFPKKLASPKVRVNKDTLEGQLYYGDICIARATMGYKHVEMDKEKARTALMTPGFLLKIIPHVDGTPRICELVRYQVSDLTVKGAWTGPGSLELFPHALAPIADLPVKRVISATHILTDLTLPYGEVAYDYLKH